MLPVCSEAGQACSAIASDTWGMCYLLICTKQVLYMKQKKMPHIPHLQQTLVAHEHFIS